MASATERKPFSVQSSAPPTLSDMLLGISSLWAEVAGAKRVRLAKKMIPAHFIGTSFYRISVDVRVRHRTLPTALDTAISAMEWAFQDQVVSRRPGVVEMLGPLSRGFE